MYENEYDKYRYVITDDSHISNNNKIITHSSYVYNSKSGESVENEEHIYTYIKIQPNSYTFFPNFVEGITGHEYNVHKLAYGYSTNNMVADGCILDFTDENSYGSYTAKGDKEILYNVKSTYNLPHPFATGQMMETVIDGVGIEVLSSDTSLFAGVEYDTILKARVYYFNYINGTSVAIKNNKDVYDHLTIELPGTVSGTYTTESTDDFVKLTINNANKHIGNVLVKISFDWKNNKFTLYKTINFAAIINNINSIKNIYFNVNDEENTVENRTTVFLEGDYINNAIVVTNPERANGWVQLTVDPNNDHTSYLVPSGEKIGAHEKLNNYDGPHEFPIGKSLRALTTNKMYDTMFSHIEYNYNPVSQTYLGSVTKGNKIFKFVPSNISVLDTNTNSEVAEEIYEHTSVNGSFNLAWSSATSHYSRPLNRRNSYNIVDVNCHYTQYVSLIDDDVPVTDINSTNLIFDESTTRNAYTFSKNIDVPGRYIFTCHTKNGNVEHNQILKKIIYQQTQYSGIKQITTYEGACGIELLSHNIISSYTINTSSVTKNILNNSYYTPNYNFNNWTNNYAYLNTITDKCTTNVGLVYPKGSEIEDLISQFMNDYGFDRNNDGYIDNSELGAISNLITSANIPPYIMRFDLNNDGMVDVSDISSIIDIVNGARLISPFTNSNDEEEFITLYFDDKQNNYKQIYHKYNISVKKFKIETGITLRGTISGSQRSIYYRCPTDCYFPYDGKIPINNEEVDIKDFSGDITVTIETSLFLWPETLASQEPCKNFKLSATTGSWNDGHGNIVSNIISNYSSTYNNNNYVLTTTFKINKNNWNNQTQIVNEIVNDYTVKLTRKSVSGTKFTESYWDDYLGFADALVTYDIHIRNSQQSIEDGNIGNILLFTNVCSNDGSYTKTYKHKYIQNVVGNSVEKFKIYKGSNLLSDGSSILYLDESGNKVESPTNNNWVVSIDHQVNNGAAYVIFTTNPAIKTSNINKTITGLKFTSNTAGEYNVKIWLLSANLTINNQPLYYLEDVNNSNNKLYSEYLLSNSIGNNITDNSTFITSFCGSTGYAILSNYNITNNGILLQIRQYISTGSGNTDELWHNNVSYGILLNVDTANNMWYVYDKQVLIPKVSGNILLNLTNQYDSNTPIVIGSRTLTVSQVQVDNNIKLFTNGFKN